MLHQRVIGQEEAISPLVCAYARSLSGLRDARRPMLTSLLLGPTGVGKTEMARAVAASTVRSQRPFQEMGRTRPAVYWCCRRSGYPAEANQTNSRLRRKQTWPEARR